MRFLRIGSRRLLRCALPSLAFARDVFDLDAEHLVYDLAKRTCNAGLASFLLTKLLHIVCTRKFEHQDAVGREVEGSQDRGDEPCTTVLCTELVEDLWPRVAELRKADRASERSFG